MGLLERLFRLDATTGEATFVSSLDSDTNDPWGLAGTSSYLYTASDAKDRLAYITAGGTTNLSGTTGFKFSQSSPGGLGSDGNDLYLIGAGNYFIHTVDTTTGAALYKANGSSSETGYSALAGTSGTLYLAGTRLDRLYSLDTSVSPPIYNNQRSATSFAHDEESPAGLAAVGETLYMVGAGRDALYILDRETGVARKVGYALAFRSGISYPTSIAAVGETLYMGGVSNDALYKVDRSTGEAIRAGYLRLGVVRPSGMAQLSHTVASGLRFFVKEGPAILNHAVEDFAPIEGHARVTFMWSEVAGVRDAREGTAGYAVRIDAEDEEDAGLAQGWALVRGRGENTVALEVRAYIDGGTTGQVLDIAGAEVRIGIGERWYSPWSPLRVVSILKIGGEVRTGPAGQQSAATAGVTDTVSVLLGAIGVGDDEDREAQASLWAQVLCMMGASAAAAGVFYVTGRGGASVGLGAATFLFIWSGLGLTLFGMHPALALLPLLLLLMGAAGVLVVKFKT